MKNPNTRHCELAPLDSKTTYTWKIFSRMGWELLSQWVSGIWVCELLQMRNPNTRHCELAPLDSKTTYTWKIFSRMGWELLSQWVSKEDVV
jgi:hypothetical protein